jgi:Cof subfamily protein (haloacid dehalogenase superfamily)
MILFACDYDGTLNRKGVSTEDIDAIVEFRKKGHLFGMATGRSIGSIRGEIDKFAFPVDFIIGNNGGAIQNHQGETVLLHTIPCELVTRVIDHLMTYDLFVYGCNDGFELGVEQIKPNPDFKPTMHTIGFNEIFDRDRVAVMFAFFADEKDAAKCVIELNEMFDGQLSCFSNKGYIDIGTFGISKKSGIDFLVDHLDIEANIHVIGDEYNDIPMISGFDGYTVESGTAEVKCVASRVFPSVAEAIKHALDSEK